MAIKNLSEKIREEKKTYELQQKLDAERIIREAENKRKDDQIKRENTQKLQEKAIGTGLLVAFVFCIAAYLLYLIIIFLLEIFSMFGGMSDLEYKTLRLKIFYVLMIGGAIIGFIRGYFDKK